jgi:hypothetical protein
MLVWAFSAVEVISALARKRREGTLDARRFGAAKRRLAEIEGAWNEVVHYDAVRARSRRLLETHALRSADALQLAAALVAVEENTAGVEFVSFDPRLADAAAKEGFTVLPPPGG